MKTDYLIIAFQLIIITNFSSSEGLNITAQNGDGDEDFRAFLISTMHNYSAWLKESELDPSPPINETFGVDGGAYRPIYLKCELSKMFLRGESDTLNDNFSSESDFTRHVFSASRNVLLQAYEYHGNLNCSGAIKRLYFQELKKDLPFTGNGNFVVTIQNSSEVIQFRNFGITTDYKLDLKYSWSRFVMLANVKNSQITAEWDEGLIDSKYSGVVQEVFGEVFKYDFVYADVTTINPAYRLLEAYLREQLQGLELRSIMAEENLPPPFPATPTPPPRTTTPSHATDNEQTTPSSGVNTSAGIWFIFVQAAFMIYLT